MPLCSCFSPKATDTHEPIPSITSEGKKRVASATTSKSNAIALAGLLTTRCLAAINLVASSDSELADHLDNCKV